MSLGILVTSSHDVTMTSLAQVWHVIGFPYKRHCAGLVGAHLGSPWLALAHHWLFCLVLGLTPGYRGMCACVDWHTGVPVLWEPTSFKLSCLGCYNFSVSIHFQGHANTLWELPRNAVFYPMSTISTGPSCLLVGAHVHCLSSCLVYISRSVLSLGETIHPSVCASQLLASLGGHQTEYDMSGPNSGLCFTSVVTRVIKCGYRKEGEQQYALDTKRVSKLDWDGFVNLASHRPHAHPMVLG